MIERKDVEHVARLARLALTDAELEKMREQLNGILAYIEKLNALQTDGVEPTSHAVPMVNVMRDDAPGPSKRIYELTEEGRRLLGGWADALRANREVVSSFLDRYEKGGDHVPRT